MKAPPQIIYTGLKRAIGAPVDYSTNLSKANF